MTHLSPAQSARLLTVPDAPGSTAATGPDDVRSLRALEWRGLVESWWPTQQEWPSFTRTPFGAETARRIRTR